MAKGRTTISLLLSTLIVLFSLLFFSFLFLSFSSWLQYRGELKAQWEKAVGEYNHCNRSNYWTTWTIDENGERKIKGIYSMGPSCSINASPFVKAASESYLWFTVYAAIYLYDISEAEFLGEALGYVVLKLEDKLRRDIKEEISKKKDPG